MPRTRICEVLEVRREGDRIGLVVTIFLAAMISLNVLAATLESVSAIGSRFEKEFLVFEWFSVAIFTVEYILRVWSIPDHPDPCFKHPLTGRLRYMATPLALLDALVLLPFYLAFFIPLDLRMLRVLRLLRVFRLTRYSVSMDMLLQVLREESGKFGAAFFALLLLIILAASVVYIAEHEAQPEAFASIPHALWWAVVTLTTIGYGDVVPVTSIGKFFGAIIGITSIGLVALPAGILASGFNEALGRRRQSYKMRVNRALEDGILDEEERADLEKLQRELGLDEKEAALILRVERSRLTRHAKCPHCGKPIMTLSELDADV